jgi:hypothetical protein
MSIKRKTDQSLNPNISASMGAGPQISKFQASCLVNYSAWSILAESESSILDSCMMHLVSKVENEMRRQLRPAHRHTVKQSRPSIWHGLSERACKSAELKVIGSIFFKQRRLTVWNLISTRKASYAFNMSGNTVF